jgi:hypothetical protein
LRIQTLIPKQRQQQDRQISVIVGENTFINGLEAVQFLFSHKTIKGNIMSHFAQVKNGIVQQVIVAEQDFIDTLPDAQNWIQTSYNTRNGIHYAPDKSGKNYCKIPDGGEALRFNYAIVNGYYDSVADVFYDPQPYPSWILNKLTWLWEAPIPKPENDISSGVFYIWDEPSVSWIKKEIKLKGQS